MTILNESLTTPPGKTLRWKWSQIPSPTQTLLRGNDVAISRLNSERSRAALEADQEAKLKIYNTDPELVSDLIANAQQRMLNYAKGIATKRARLKEHKEFNRMKVLAGVKGKNQN